MAYGDGARLLADVGSLYVRFALETSRGELARQSMVRCADYADFGGALKGYMQSVSDTLVRHAAVAISNPVEGDFVRMTNYHWQFSIEQTRQDIGLDTLVVVNDFTALAAGLPHLKPAELRQVGEGAPRERSVIGLLGAGTGLGVSALIPADDGWISLGSEGGHVSFSPTDAREEQILAFARSQFPHVSAERLLSGSGIELIYRALGHAAKKAVEPLTAPEITARGLAGQSDECTETLEVFCGMLGTAAANLAVTLGAFGGVYIGGSIVPRLGQWFDASPFRRRFESKGRFSSYVAQIPTYVITAEQATFTGLAAVLDAQLKRRGQGHSMLDRILQAQADLSPAERRVADLVLARPRSILNDPISDIAKAAVVSQPTVVRFCRSLGCEGLSDFKLRLASSLTGTIPVTHTKVTGEDSAVELSDKVLGNTASAILQTRDALNRGATDRAIDLLLAARRIEFFAVGNYGIVAEDAQYKFLRFGLPANARTEPRLQQFAAEQLGSEDVVVVVSSTGRIAELNAAIDVAMARGARVIAITASQSPLAKRASVTIAIDHAEDVATQVPMISRVLYLLVIDILAVGVAMRTGGSAAVQPGPADRARRLADMVSHSQA
ncbi:MAG: glucokinase [Betaproteobacteria bacterium]|nr:glucokinase [Betaproteobacteria bacterium]